LPFFAADAISPCWLAVVTISLRRENHAAANHIFAIKILLFIIQYCRIIDIHCSLVWLFTDEYSSAITIHMRRQIIVYVSRFDYFRRQLLSPPYQTFRFRLLRTSTMPFTLLTPYSAAADIFITPCHIFDYAIFRHCYFHCFSPRRRYAAMPPDDVVVVKDMPLPTPLADADLAVSGGAQRVQRGLFDAAAVTASARRYCPPLRVRQRAAAATRHVASAPAGCARERRCCRRRRVRSLPLPAPHVADARERRKVKE